MSDQDIAEIDSHDAHSLRPRKRVRLDHTPDHSDEERSEEEVAPAAQPVRQARPARVTRRRPAPVVAPKPTTTEPETGTGPPTDIITQSASQARPVRSTRRRNVSPDDDVPEEEVVQPAVRDETRENEDTEIQTSLPPRARPAKNVRRKKTTSAVTVQDDTPNPSAEVEDAQNIDTPATQSTTTARPARNVRRRKTARSAPEAVEEPITDQHQDEPQSEEQEEQQDEEEEEPVAEEEESDPEEHIIDTKTTSMYDISHESRYGKTSERERKMAQIDWAAVKQKRQEEVDAIIYGRAGKDKVGDNVVPSTENADDQPDGEPSEPVTRGVAGGIGYRLVNGEIVEDVDSLTIDRAARVADEAAAADEAVEEENDLTLRINRTTYLNARKRDETERVPFGRGKSDAWSEQDTDKFYDALTMFGTDFFIISKMFPPRTRKQIKLKFIREERLEPDRINAALLGKKTGKIDLDHYAQAIDRDVDDFHKYDSLEHANQVIRDSMKDKEEAMRAAVKEDEENNRQREVQRQQREKHRLETERKKEERARKKAARRGGNVWGTGTMGGADDDTGNAGE